MKNYSELLSTPQIEPIVGRTDMVKNNAGGYGFAASSQEILERFLLIGSEGGTYYVSEQKLTIENAKTIIAYINQDGKKVLHTVLDFAVDNKAPKADAGLFVLALLCTYGQGEVKTRAYDAISQVCKTSTHLFTFLSNIQNLRGWSRGLRSGVSTFYRNKSTEQLEYQLVKYRNRAGFTHRDALRLAHTKPVGLVMNGLFAYAVGKGEETLKDFPQNFPLISAFEKAQTSISDDELVALVREFHLTWEMIPSENLNKPKVLEALLSQMPLTALMRNLNRFSYNGMTENNNAVVKSIVSKLTDAREVAKSKVHPLNVVNSMFTYSSGRGVKGNKTWTANQNIVDALGTTYELALKNVVPTNKNILVAVDVSGSMSHPVNGMQMQASQIAAVLGTTILKSEPNAELMWFDTAAYHPKVGRRSSLDGILKSIPHGGGTDCSLAFQYALHTKTKYDAIIILTDSETWAGKRHGFEFLNRYRQTINNDVKVVEVAMVANHHSTLPEDKNLLRVVGFDSSVTEVINRFIVRD